MNDKKRDELLAAIKRIESGVERHGDIVMVCKALKGLVYVNKHTAKPVHSINIDT